MAGLRQLYILPGVVMVAEKESKRVKLGDNPWLKSLTEHAMVFEGQPIDYEIIVVAVRGQYGDWAAYFETPWTPFGSARVADYGNKLPETVAAEIFPEWAKELKWRP